MLLVIDIGNTNIVFGLFEDKKLREVWRMATQRGLTSDQIAAFLKSTFEINSLTFAAVNGVIISSVVPLLTHATEDLAKKYFSCDSITVNSQTDIGIANAYTPPSAVGADRLVNGVAAWNKYNTACVIVDFGTATTVDAVDAEGTYVGGALAPGVHISTSALFDAAAKLPRVERLELIEIPHSALGKNTEHSVQSGIIFGYAGLVKELVSRTAAELVSADSPEITVIATGGLANIIAPLVPQIQHREPNLTLEGLRLIWQRVKGQ